MIFACIWPIKFMWRSSKGLLVLIWDMLLWWALVYIPIRHSPYTILSSPLSSGIPLSRPPTITFFIVDILIPYSRVPEVHLIKLAYQISCSRSCLTNSQQVTIVRLSVLLHNTLITLVKHLASSLSKLHMMISITQLTNNDPICFQPIKLKNILKLW